MFARNQQRDQASDGRESEIQQHQEAPLEGAEHGVQHQHDYQDGERDHDRQATIGALLALVLAGPLQRVALRQLHFAIHLHHGLLDGAAQIAAADAVLNGDVTLVAFAVDHRRAVFNPHVSDLGERNAFSAGGGDPDVANVVHGLPELLLVPRHEVEALLTDQNLADRIATDRGLNCVLNVGSIDTETVRLFAIDHDVNVGLTEHPEQPEIGNPGDRPHYGHDLFAFLLQIFQVGAEDLHGKFTFNAADGFFHVVGDGLGESPGHAGNLLDFVVHGLDQQFLAATELRTPFTARLEIDEVLGVEEAGGVGAVIGAADLRYHFRHFRKAGENNARLVHHFAAGSGTCTGGQGAASPDRTLIEMGKELRANHSRESKVAHQGKTHDRRGQNDGPPNHDPTQRPLITGRNPLDDRVVPGMRAFTENIACEHRRKDDGKQQRAQQCERHGPRHGLEEAALHPLQGEDRQVGDDDNGDGVKHRALHFMCRGTNSFVHRSVSSLPAFEAALDVLDHHGRAFHAHAEVGWTERQ